MNYKWLNKTSSDKLIIFFNGWGMDEKIVEHLLPEDFNVIVFYDYNTLDIEVNLSKFTEKYIIAWSMGVMTATLFKFENVKSSTAICGTPFAVDDEYGIPTRIYNLTIKGFSEKSSDKFMNRMFLSKPEIDKFSNRTFESKLSELKQLLTYKPNTDFKYTKSIVADTDIIIPTKNQLNYWKAPEIIHSGHCPFYLYTKWSELL